MGVNLKDFISGGCDVALPDKPFRGHTLIDGALVEAADGGRITRNRVLHTRSRWRAYETLYGLSAAVWSRSIEICLTAARRIKAGTIRINSFMDGYPGLQFGG